MVVHAPRRQLASCARHQCKAWDARVQAQHVVQHRQGLLSPTQIEVGMLGHVDGRGGTALGLERDVQLRSALAGIFDGVGDACLDIAWVPLSNITGSGCCVYISA